MTDTAFKILTAEQWAEFETDGVFTGSSVDLVDGYIHLSTANQLEETLNKHFAGQTGLVIAEIDLNMLGDTVHWEISRGDALFPHVYGVLPRATVMSVRTTPAAISA